jgi:RNA polymerase subunit RPABC4/transcription elongation factor Spt4
MALQPCAECGALISDQARSCPVCGKPGPKPDAMAPEERIGWLVLFIIVALVALILQQ